MIYLQFRYSNDLDWLGIVCWILLIHSTTQKNTCALGRHPRAANTLHLFHKILPSVSRPGVMRSEMPRGIYKAGLEYSPVIKFAVAILDHLHSCCYWNFYVWYGFPSHVRGHQRAPGLVPSRSPPQRVARPWWFSPFSKLPSGDRIIGIFLHVFLGVINCWYLEISWLVFPRAIKRRWIEETNKGYGDFIGMAWKYNWPTIWRLVSSKNGKYPEVEYVWTEVMINYEI